VHAPQDPVIGDKEAAAALLVFLSPSCSYCLGALQQILIRNDFKKRSLVIKWTPELNERDLIIGAYLTCKLDDPNQLIDRLIVTTTVLDPKNKKVFDDLTKIAYIRMKFGLSEEAAKQCRNLETYRTLLGNYKSWRTTGSTGLPAWFVGDLKSEKEPGILRVDYVQAGDGGTSMAEALFK
jgi:hypothetical protein